MSRRPRALVVILAATAAVAAGALLLGPSAGVALLEAWLGGRLGLEVDIERADFSFSGPQVLDGVRIAAPPGYSDEPILSMERLTFGGALFEALRHPRSLDAEGVQVAVERLPAGRNSLVDALERTLPFRRRAAQGLERLRVRRLTAHLRDRRARAVRWIRQATISCEIDGEGLRVETAGRTATGDEEGAFEVRWRRGPHGRRLEAHVRALDLDALEPLVAPLLGRLGLGGRFEGDFVWEQRPGKLSIEGPLVVRGLRLALPAAGLHLDSAEPDVRIDGSLGLSYRGALLLEAESFALSSSLVALAAHGRWEIAPDRLAGTGSLRFGLDADRMVKRAGDGWVRALGLLAAGGNLDARWRFVGPDTAALELSGERVFFAPSEERLFAAGTVRLRVDRLAFDPALGAFRADDLSLATPFLDVSGDVSFRVEHDARVRPVQAECDARLDGGRLERFLGRAAPRLPLRLAGPLEGELSLREEGAGVAGLATLESDWFSFRFEEPEGRLWDFTGRTLRAVVRGRTPWPPARDPCAFGLRVEADADRAEIYRTPIEGWLSRFALDEGRFEGRAEGRTYGGSFSARIRGEIAPDPHQILELSADGVAVVDRFPAWLAAAACPIFARRPGPFAVQSDVRMSGRATVRSAGVGLAALLEGMEGAGDLEFAGTHVRGSPLLSALADAELEDEVPFGGASCSVEFAPGRLVSRVELVLEGGRRVRFCSSCDATGRIDVPIAPELLFDAAFVARHRALLERARFGLAGNLFQPVARLPRPSHFRRLVLEGRAEEALAELERLD